MPACSVVLDASVILRAFVDADQGAHAWFTRIDEEDVAAAWPDLVFAETAHGVARYVRTGRLTREEGLLVVHRALSAPVQSERTGVLADAAVHVALARSISAYDACYVVLAETMKATLVTADRRLAAATATSVLI